jgi:hypothetical protein
MGMLLICDEGGMEDVDEPRTAGIWGGSAFVGGDTMWLSGTDERGVEERRSE